MREKKAEEGQTSDSRYDLNLSDFFHFVNCRMFRTSEQI